jgi:phospholipase/carboxylesterase
MAEPETSQAVRRCPECGAALTSQNSAFGDARDVLCRACAWRRAADPAHTKSAQALRTAIAEPMTHHLDGDTNTPTQLVLLLHGLGTNAENLRPLARRVADAVPRTLCVLPDAPWLLIDAMPRDEAMMAKIMAPAKDWEASRSWLPALHPTARNARPATAGAATSGSDHTNGLTAFQHSFDPLMGALDRLVNSVQAQFGIAPEALAVYGFSVGAAVATYFGVRREPACAGVVCHSGAVPGVSTVASRPPMLLMAGSRELGFFKPLRKSFPASAEALRAQSIPVEEQVVEGLGHDINSEAVERVTAFLRRVLGVPYG